MTERITPSLPSSRPTLPGLVSAEGFGAIPISPRAIGYPIFGVFTAARVRRAARVTDAREPAFTGPSAGSDSHFIRRTP